MVIFVNGSLGVGKSSVAKYLLWSYPKTVLLEGDALCNINPFDAYDPNRIEVLSDIVCYMIERYRRIGFNRFVVDTIFEKKSEIERINSMLLRVESDISHYLLLSSDQKREERIRKRNRENYVWEIERSKELQAILAAEFQHNQLVHTVDVTNLEVSDVGELILRDRGKIA